MKIADIVLDKIERLRIGYVFTYADFNLPVEKNDALIKSLNRLVKEGKIRKLSKGRFYKPRITEFGELKPEVYQVVKDLLEKDGKLIGYLTGYSVYNTMGLTTQIPSILQIGTEWDRKAVQRGMYKIKFVKQPNRITKENIPLLRIIDAVKYIKDIPDTTVDISCKKLLSIIQTIEKEKYDPFIKLIQKYNPATRALLGAMIDMGPYKGKATPLFNSLNPSTTYDFNIQNSTLPNKEKWFIR